MKNFRQQAAGGVVPVRYGASLKRGSTGSPRTENSSPDRPELVEGHSLMPLTGTHPSCRLPPRLHECLTLVA